MPKVSVIMPVYNVSMYLETCLQSVLSQTFKDFELICINDGSTDDSGDILKKYAELDTRIKIIEQENKGLSSARNKGIEIAKGQYITFIDSDDYYTLDFLEHLFTIQQKTCADIVGCDYQKIHQDDICNRHVEHVSYRLYNNALQVLLDKRNFIHFNVWNKLYTKAVIGDIRFIPGIYYEDWVFNCCVFEKAKTFCWIKNKLYAYRYSENSIMRSPFNKKKIIDYVKGIQAVHLYFQKEAPSKWEKVKKTRIARTVKMMMNSARRSGNILLVRSVAKELKKLKTNNIIGYQGLSIINKLKLFKLLHSEVEHEN